MATWAEKHVPELFKATQDTSEASQIRKDFFIGSDLNRSKLLSLGEIQNGICKKNGDFERATPAIKRAFDIAKDSKASTKDKGGDMINPSEGKLFFQTLIQSYRYWLRFKKMDDNNEDRVSLAEFVKAHKGSGDPEKQFKEMDVNGGGWILYDEWCNYNVKHEALFNFLDD